MSARYPGLRALPGARLRSCQELLLDFESDAARLPAALGAILSSLRTILDEAIRRFEARLGDAADGEARAIIERSYLDFANDMGSFAEILTEGTDDPYLPVDLLPAMAVSIDRPLRDHAMLPRSVTDTSYSTRSHAEPLALVADMLPAGPPLHPDLLRFPSWLTFLDIPRSFRDSMLTHVIVLGHELAHAEDQFANYTYSDRVKEGLSLGHEENDAVVAALVENWVEELLADVVAVRRLGPAAIVLFGEYAGLIQVLGPSRSPSLLLDFCRAHPLAEVRLWLMFQELDSLDYGGEFGPLAPAMTHWRAVAADGATAPSDAPEEFTRADAIIRTAFPAIREAAAALSPTKVYTRAQFTHALDLAQLFAQGIAPSDRLELTSGRIVSRGETIEDLYTAATIVRASSQHRQQLADQIPEDADAGVIGREAMALRKLDELLSRAVEGVRLWEDWPKELRGE